MNGDPQDIQYFEKQKKIYPKKVKGVYRNLKWISMVVTLAIYYLTPFVRWDRGPHVPDQAVLIDLDKGRAYWLWFEIWPQEVYILTGILIVAAIALFFVTSILGRVWCGYLCFQTVWTDLFVWVERLVQGDRNQRKKLCEGPWTWEKIYKLTITHFLWLVIGWCTAGSFVLYFNDAPTLVRSFINLNVSPTVLWFIGGLTFSTYLMAGFAREQVCTFMCPYARFQSAMFDKDTLIIGYDKVRGEPRGKHKKGESWDGKGDCINCTACVQVCPMGIDIRDGLQMDCIACGLCIDACDDIMDKIELPRGLIRYDTETNLESGKSERKPLFRARTIYYIVILLVVSVIVLYSLVSRPLLEMTALHDRNPIFVQLSDGSIRNGYEIKILNKTHQNRNYQIKIDGLEDAEIIVKSAGNLTSDILPVSANSVAHYRLLVSMPLKPQEPKEFTFVITDNGGNPSFEYESIFISKRPE